MFPPHILSFPLPGLKALTVCEKGPPKIVIIHDAVRPFVDEKVSCQTAAIDIHTTYDKVI